MSFEDFAKMAKEEFGLTVVKAPECKQSSFESLFGVATKCIERYELPFSVSVEQLAETRENINKLMQSVSALITKTGQSQVRIKRLERYIYDEDKDISEE